MWLTCPVDRLGRAADVVGAGHSQALSGRQGADPLFPPARPLDGVHIAERHGAKSLRQRRETFLILRLPRRRQGGQRPPVKRTLHRDDLVATLPPFARKLNSINVLLDSAH